MLKSQQKGYTNCQDTGTATIIASKGQQISTGVTTPKP